MTTTTASGSAPAAAKLEMDKFSSTASYLYMSVAWCVNTVAEQAWCVMSERSCCAPGCRHQLPATAAAANCQPVCYTSISNMGKPARAGSPSRSAHRHTAAALPSYRE